jgi:hypothetical protein
MKQAITHPGTAHGDDFLTACILVAKFNCTVTRREPTKNDLDDPDICVFDVGGRNEPTNLNFDHHQSIEIPCSLNLILSWLGHDSLGKFRRAFHWFDNVDFRDRNGVKRLGDKYGLREEQMLELASPVHASLLDTFEKFEQIRPLPDYIPYSRDDLTAGCLYEIMRNIGDELIQYAGKYDLAWQRLDSCVCRLVGNTNILIYPSTDETATGDFARYKKIDIIVSHDKRGNGWSIFRSNNDAPINLAGLAEHPAIAFSHKAGFIAKTKERIEPDEIISLIFPEMRD